MFNKLKILTQPFSDKFEFLVTFIFVDAVGVFNVLTVIKHIIVKCTMNLDYKPTYNVSSWKNLTTAIGFFLSESKSPSGRRSSLATTSPGHQQFPSFTQTISLSE